MLRAWDRQCAFCSHDGQVAGALVGVDAAHVRWPAFGAPDELDNGLALSVLHHKLFDFGRLAPPRGWGPANDTTGAAWPRTRTRGTLSPEPRGQDQKGEHRRRERRMFLRFAALVLGVVALGPSRSQIFVDDQAYMKGMIPHHSIAILTSERADIDDVRVRELADEIIEAQRREIAEMEWLIEDIEANGPLTTEEAADERPVPEFSAQP